MASEITEDENQNPFFIDKEAEKIRIRQIINYQKSLYYSSSSSASSSLSSAAASASTSSSKSSSLLDLMKEGSTSLRRLFNMEHTSLKNYFNEYSVSPIIKPILLWGSDTDNDEVQDDPWGEITRIGGDFRSRFGDQSRVLSSQGSRNNEKKENTRRRKLIRTKSYKRLPRFSLWIFGKFKFKLRLIRKLKVVIKGRVF